jgi:GNAT superfamily N-acetyltransferase
MRRSVGSRQRTVDEIAIRSMASADVAAASSLADQLGYRKTPQAIERWLANKPDSQLALVAETDGEVVGWLEAHDLELMQYPRFLEIGGLVVAEHMRGRGIGKRLIEAVVDWGRQRGHTEIRVRSNVIRDQAHGFYEGLGFERRKTSYTFSIDIG